MLFYLKALSFFLLVNLSAISLSAQVLWPGDVNNNGVVNGVDWIYLSNIIGEAGPAREIGETGIDWEAKSIASLWGTSFPGTTIDYAYADCNGDGIVDFMDLEAVDLNYLEEHGIVEDDISLIGDLGVDPELFFETLPFNPFPQGTIILLELNLGTAAIPVESFSGITFKVTFDPEIVSTLDFLPPEEGESDWSEAGMFLLQREDVDEGEIEFAFSTFNTGNLENSFGILGRFFIVIEDDVVGMQGTEVETEFRIESVFMLGGEDFGVVPVINDTLEVTIVENPLSTDDFIDAESVKIFPNPVYEKLYLETDHQVEKVEIYNSIGQKISTYESTFSNLQELDFSSFSPGIYCLKIYTEEGILTKKALHY